MTSVDPRSRKVTNSTELVSDEATEMEPAMTMTPAPSQASRSASPKKRYFAPSPSSTESSSLSVDNDDEIDRRSTGAHSVSVADFNRFKNGILTRLRLSSCAAASSSATRHPHFILSYAPSSYNVECPRRTLRRPNASGPDRNRDIESRMSMVEARRVNYVNQLRRKQELLSSSLSIKQIKPNRINFVMI